MPAASTALSAPQKALHKLGLVRPVDLALHLPFRYDDESRLWRLGDACDGEVVQFEATVEAAEVALRPRRQLKVSVRDGDQTCVLRFFTFYPALQKLLVAGQRVRVRGEIRSGLMERVMVHPTCAAAGGPLPQGLTPVYSTSAGLPQAYLRRAVTRALAKVDLSPTLPPALQAGQPWAAWSLAQAIAFLHQPPAQTSVQALLERQHPAWGRLKAEELLAQQLSQALAKQGRALLQAPALHATEGGLAQRLLAQLPFALTAAQQRVCGEIQADLARPVPMHRLLQGDVGAGKTVVAALAAMVAIEAGWQCALMAPTEILARQHFAKLVAWLEPLGVEVAWLTGSQKKSERAQMLALVASGQAALVVGTHAVIQEQVRFHRLGLAVIDEQHRFGVAQRLALREKMQGAGLEPHVLMMTATPIPRTLAMSYCADLDVSVIDELPPGRTPVVTRAVAAHRKADVVERLAAQVAQGRQVYWVCPLIEESEALDLTNAIQTHVDLCAALPGVGVGLLHSRMPAADKLGVMQSFVAGQVQVLVSTTVIEVGVDVPNATLMVIEHAERFGLSQLHQLRGRVGRGAAVSACVLLYSAGESGRLGDVAKERLRAMVETTDGFEIARRDLSLRGPGEFLGARQSGVPLLRFADLDRDAEILEWARGCAAVMLDQYPQEARRHVQRWLEAKAQYLKA